MQTCQECERLAKEYENAVKSHLKILAETDRALDEKSTTRLRELEPLLVEASERRSTARSALKKHQEIHLNKSGEVSGPE